MKNLLLKQEKRREKNKDSKGNRLNFNKLEMQSYLKSNKISSKEAKILFKIRTNMLEVKKNYKRKFGQDEHILNDNDNILCPLGDNHLDTEENILKCENLKTDNDDSDLKFNDLFSKDEEKAAKTLKQFYKKWKIRQQMLLD